jgi:hypothetical protein
MEPQPDLMSVYARISRLERQNRRMKIAGTIAMVLAASIIVMGQAKTAEVVTANEFVLKDADGKVRAKIGMGIDVVHKDGPAIVLFDAENSPRISLSTSEDDARVEVNSFQPRVFSVMWAGPPGKSGSGLGVNGPAGVFRVDLDGPDFDGPQVLIKDKEGYATEMGRFDIVTNTGRKEKTQAASLALFDKNKKAIWSAP